MRGDPELVVVAAGVAAALHVGKLPVALPVLREALGIGVVEAGFLLSLVQGAGMTAGLAVGLAADAIGLRRCMAIGLAVLAVAGLAGATVRGADAVPWLLALRVVEGVGLLLTALPAPALIRRLRAGRGAEAALGLWGAYMPAGVACALLAGPWVIGLAGWRAWWIAVALASLAVAAWLWLAVPPDPRAASREPAAAGRLARTLAAPGPWLLALSFAMYSGQWLAVIGFLPTIYSEAGIAATTGGLLTALAAAANGGGNIVAGRLLQRGASAPRLLRIGFAAMALGAWLAAWPIAGIGPFATPLRYAAVVAFSGFGGLIPGTLFALSLRLAPDGATVSTTVGWMQQLSALGQFAGPPLVAVVALASGGWQWSWTVTGACAVAGLLLASGIAALLGRDSMRAASPRAEPR